MAAARIGEHLRRPRRADSGRPGAHPCGVRLGRRDLAGHGRAPGLGACSRRPGTPHPADPQRRAHTGDHDPVPGTLTVVSVGRIDPLKDCETLLRVAAECSLRVPEATFLHYGPVQPGEEAYARRCVDLHRRLNLGHKFRFMGSTSDPSGAMRLADVVLMTSMSEGLPLSALEAMAEARPVVATSVGGIPMCLQGCGIVAPPAAVEDLAGAVVMLLEDLPARVHARRAWTPPGGTRLRRAELRAAIPVAARRALHERGGCSMSDMRTEHALAIVRGQLRRMPADALEAAVVLEASAGIAPDRALDLGKATVKASRHSRRASVGSSPPPCTGSRIAAKRPSPRASWRSWRSSPSSHRSERPPWARGGRRWSSASRLQGLLFRRYFTGQARLGIIRRYPIGVIACVAAAAAFATILADDHARRGPDGDLDRRHHGRRARVDAGLRRVRGRDRRRPPLRDARHERSRRSSASFAILVLVLVAVLTTTPSNLRPCSWVRAMFSTVLAAGFGVLIWLLPMQWAHLSPSVAAVPLVLALVGSTWAASHLNGLWHFVPQVFSETELTDNAAETARGVVHEVFGGAAVRLCGTWVAALIVILALTVFASLRPGVTDALELMMLLFAITTLAVETALLDTLPAPRRRPSSPIALAVGTTFALAPWASRTVVIAVGTILGILFATACSPAAPPRAAAVRDPSRLTRRRSWTPSSNRAGLTTVLLFMIRTIIPSLRRSALLAAVGPSPARRGLAPRRSDRPPGPAPPAPRRGDTGPARRRPRRRAHRLPLRQQRAGDRAVDRAEERQRLADHFVHRVALPRRQAAEGARVPLEEDDPGRDRPAQRPELHVPGRGAEQVGDRSEVIGDGPERGPAGTRPRARPGSGSSPRR